MIPIARARRTVSGICLVILFGLSSACGGSNNTGNPPDGGSAAGGDIVGGELLEWDQLAPSPEAAQAYTYALYVDGTRNTTLGGVRCDPADSVVGFRCSGVLPTLSRGTHSLQITSTEDGRESPLSAALSVNVR
jgi:hypothetical protein